MQKRKNYYQVHMNKRPKKLPPKTKISEKEYDRLMKAFGDYRANQLFFP